MSPQSPASSSASLPTLHNHLLAWYHRHGRSLPWRSTRDPYAILVSEVMLQQTQVDRVVPKYHEFLSLFPTLQALAQASAAQVIRAWAPLGYNRRAVRLHQLAQQVTEQTEQYEGALPQEPAALRRLKGIGAYTAAAVACFAFGREVPVVDTNVRRVLSRLFHGVQPVAEAGLRATASHALPPGQASAWNQALMDLGAMVCTSQRPHCRLCPLREHCMAAPALQGSQTHVAEARQAYRTTQPPFQGSHRYYRGRVVDFLRHLEDGAIADLPTLGRALKPSFQEEDVPWLVELLEGLAQDGLVHLHHTEDRSAPAAVSLPR